MIPKEIIQSEIKEIIKNNPESFPFLAQYWEANIIDSEKLEDKDLLFGKYNSRQKISVQFYKPYSKIIGLNKSSQNG